MTPTVKPLTKEEREALEGQHDTILVKLAELDECLANIDIELAQAIIVLQE